MRRAAERGHEVLFVHTSPFLPRLLVDVIRRRAPRAALSEVGRPRRAADRVLTLTAPNVLPWGRRFRVPNLLNNLLAAVFVKRAARRLEEPHVLWVYDPCAAGVIGRTGEALVLYDCVDDFSSIASYGPGEQALAAACDAHCAAEADVVSVTTSSLYERHRKHSNVHLVRNVGDYAHFETAVDPRNAPADLRSLAHPVLGFAGNIVPGKIDLDLVEHLVDSYPNGSIVLAGPVDPELESRVAQLRSRPNFRSLGLVPYRELPSVVSSFDVGLIPYVANGYTRSCFPLKLYEYLAAGKPVIASGLPELAGMEPDVALAPDPDEFVRAVERALTRLTDADVDRRRRLAGENTWDSRTETLLQLVRDRTAQAAVPLSRITVPNQR